MRIKSILSKLTIAIILLAVSFSCTDDEIGSQPTDYGYVQFKLIKNGGINNSSSSNTRTADADILDSLADAKKIKVTLKSQYDVIEQTVTLTAVNGKETENGLWSEKIQILAGSYRLVGYELLDLTDHTLLTYDQEETDPFEVKANGLFVKTVDVNVRPRGLVKFQLVKDFSLFETRSITGAYRMDQVDTADITVEHLQTGELCRITGIPTIIDYYYDEGDNTQHGRLLCDTLVALKAGDYVATSFVLYDDKRNTLEAAMVNTSLDCRRFSVSDGKTTTAQVPITMQPTSPIIQDGITLKKIWEALDGPNWSYRGIAYTEGSNWDFERDIDLWTAQPGVRVTDDGRVASIALGGFGAKGDMPSCLGDLTELKSLTIGTHLDGLGKSPIGEVAPDEMIRLMRESYKLISAPDYSLMQMDEAMWKTMPADKQALIKKSQERGNLSAKGLDEAARVPDNYLSYITSLPESMGKLKNLTSLFIASCPIKALPDSLSYLDKCTDIAIYNCPKLTEIPACLMQMPKLTMLYFANNSGISADKLYEGLKKWNTSPSAKTLQGIYFMNNNTEVVPDLRGMEKLSFLDMQNNHIRKFEAAFGKVHNFGTLNLSGNQLSSLPTETDEKGNKYFAGYEAVETWSFSGNKFVELPNIFDAESPFLSGTIDFSANQIERIEGQELSREEGGYKGLNVEILNLSFNRFKKLPKCIYNSHSRINYLQMRGCGIREFEEKALTGPYTFITVAMDLADNRLKELPAEFNARTFPYLSGLDLSGNAFEGFAYNPLNIAKLTTYIFRGQRNDEGYRCMREWPVGISSSSVLNLYLGSNDIRKVSDGSLEKLKQFIDLTDNPNLSIDLTDACPNIMKGIAYVLVDPGQDVRGCDAILPKE